MAIVSVAIVLSFHLKNQPSAAELAMARPLGVVFWILSVACLLVGLGNYIGTSRNRYSCQVGLDGLALSHTLPPPFPFSPARKRVRVCVILSLIYCVLQKP